MVCSEKKAIAQRKRYLTAQIRALTAERAALCIAAKSKDQSCEYRYLMLAASVMVLIRIRPMCDPTSGALNAGITKIMNHYGHLKKACSGAQYTTEPGDSLAFENALNAVTQVRWRAPWELWEWTEKGPVFFAKKF